MKTKSSSEMGKREREREREIHTLWERRGRIGGGERLLVKGAVC